MGETQGRVTLEQVAAKAGVSRTTASLVLAGRRDMRISADTERRVREAARELSYRPHLTAGSLRGRPTRTVGFICDTVASDTFAGQMIQGALTTALREDHLLIVGETTGDPLLEEQLIRSMQDRGVDGYLYACMYTQEITVPELLQDQPLVLVNCTSPVWPTVAAVVPDEYEAGRTAVQLLLAAGHTDRTFLVGETPAQVVAAVQRRRGIDDALIDAGRQLAGTVDCAWWPGSAYAAVHQFLDSGGEPTAFICLNDRVALGVYQVLHHAGFNIPDEVSVVSFDDSDLAGWIRPGLTSIAIPHYELGRTAIEDLLYPTDQPKVQLIHMPTTTRSSVSTARR